MSLVGWTDLTARTKLVLRGPDAERYLNGQTTQNIAHANHDHAIYALVTSVKGKMEADLFVSRWKDDQFLIDAPAELRESLLERLDRYLISDDAEWEDQTDSLGLIHVLGNDLSGARRSARWGQSGVDVFWPIEQSPPTVPGPELSNDALEAQRIALGIPRWGAELTPEILPQEARVESRAIDFQKGCYIGQEVISRIKSVGKVNKLLCLLHADECATGEGLEPAAKLFQDTSEVGWITSSSYDPTRNRITCLGYVKSRVAEPGITLSVESLDSARSLTIAPYPQS